jgi:hypothetical protein
VQGQGGHSKEAKKKRGERIEKKQDLQREREQSYREGWRRVKRRISLLDQKRILSFFVVF